MIEEIRKNTLNIRHQNNYNLIIKYDIISGQYNIFTNQNNNTLFENVATCKSFSDLLEILYDVFEIEITKDIIDTIKKISEN